MGTLKAKRKSTFSTDILTGAISGLKSHLFGVGWTLPKIRAKQSKSEIHFCKLVQEIWNELSSFYFQSLVERIPRIRKAVMVAKEGHFDESKV